MIEEKPAQDAHQDTGTHPETITPIPSPPMVIQPQQSVIPPQQTSSDPAADSKSNQIAQAIEALDAIEEPMGVFERRMLRATWCGIGLAVITGVIFFFQFREMQKQSGILNTQAQQAAKDSIEASKKVEQQLSIAQAQVDATQRQMRQDQRPWIGIIENGKFLSTLKGASFPIRFGLTAASKTPARDIRAFFVLKCVVDGTLKKLPAWNDKFAGPVNSVLIGTMFPGQTQDWTIEHQDETGKPAPFSAAELSSLNDGKSFFILYGVVAYRDTFGTQHWTQFCSWGSIKPGNYKAAICTEYSNTDHN
jgi:hypothetical protein